MSESVPKDRVLVHDTELLEVYREDLEDDLPRYECRLKTASLNGGVFEEYMQVMAQVFERGERFTMCVDGRTVTSVTMRDLFRCSARVNDVRSILTAQCAQATISCGRYARWLLGLLLKISTPACPIRIEP